MRFRFTGVIPVEKPVGVTSRKVVDAVARAAGMSAVGHAGTLDPLAAGVMVVCLVHATKLVDFIHQQPKRYEAGFRLGCHSVSDDLETPVEEDADPPRPQRDEILAALPAFRGEILQRPCDYSAVHVDGQRAYRLARKGRDLALAEKRVRIDRLEILAYDWPRLALAIDCSSGTFIRAIGRDLAAALGTRAVMESLVRTSVGPFPRAACLAYGLCSPETVAAAILPPLTAVPHLPRYLLDASELDAAVRGGLLPLSERSFFPAAAPDTLAAIDAAGELVGILSRHASGAFRLRPNFRGLG